MAAPPLLRGLPLLRLRLRLRLHCHRSCSLLTAGLLSPLSRPLCSSARPDDEPAARAAAELLRVSEPPKLFDDSDYRKWREKEEEILRDIEPIILLAKDILHSRRYMDGERLTAEDERAVIDNLLTYHPHSEDKIGCGLESIMVDRHPQFRHSRCLFVIRTNGSWIDFSYQKCLREYIRSNYPAHAERFIREHFKRGSG